MELPTASVQFAQVEIYFLVNKDCSKIKDFIAITLLRMSILL